MKDKWRNRNDEWALVTGGCSGIGLAIAEKLAGLGYNVVLADINGAALRKAEYDLYGRYGVRVRIMEIDLARRESAGRLHDRCVEDGISPVILVNNAGIFSYNDILKTDPEKIETMIGLHVLTVSLLCRLFGADMAARGRGYILNMSSYSMWMAWPGLALYSATKGYIRSFSRSLSGEMTECGVVVTTVLPAGVTTGLYGLSGKLQGVGRRFGVLMTPARTAEVSLSAMFRGRRQYVPVFLMLLVLPLVRIMPEWILRFVRRKTLRFQK